MEEKKEWPSGRVRLAPSSAASLLSALGSKRAGAFPSPAFCVPPFASRALDEYFHCSDEYISGVARGDEVNRAVCPYY